jgi:membrane associated rhomboid family serine protease
MLEDRHYMRRNPFGTGWWSTTSLLVIANIVAFVFQLVLEGAWRQADNYLALSVDGVLHGYIWQFLTFQFMHGGWIHLLFNCLAIFMFGRDVEQALGRKRFLTLYLSSGALGGLFQVIFSKALAFALSRPEFEAIRVVGASAGAFGLIAAFATLTPEKPIMLFIYFIPVNMRAKFLLLFEGVFALLGLAMTGRSQVAHAAHLGGMITGIIFIKYIVGLQWPEFHVPNRRRVNDLVKVPSQSSGRWGQKKNGTAEDLPPEEFLSKEVDPILDKISAHGIQSLTERERRILQAAREKMVKR